MKSRHRTQAEEEHDKQRAITLFRLGYRLRDISSIINDELKQAGSNRTISHITVSRDIAETIAEAREARKTAAIDDLEAIIELIEDTYLDARLMRNSGDAIKALNLITKLKGMQQPEKHEVTLKYDISIE